MASGEQVSMAGLDNKAKGNCPVQKSFPKGFSSWSDSYYEGYNNKLAKHEG